MALTVTTRGNYARNTGAENTLAFVPGSNCTAGATLVLIVGWDNSGAAGVDPYAASGTITDTKGNTWTQRQARNRTPGAASNDGFSGRIFETTQAGGTLTTGDTITLTLSGVTTVVRVARLLEITSSLGTATYLATGAEDASTASPSIATTGTGAVAIGDVVIVAFCREGGGDTITTNDVDTTGGPAWTQDAGGGVLPTCDVGATNAGGQLVAAWKIPTSAASVQTYSVTLSAARDGVEMYVVYTEVVTAPPTAASYDSTAFYEPTFIDSAGGAPYVEYTPPVGSSILALIDNVDTDWSMTVPIRFDSVASAANILEFYYTTGPVRSLTLGIDASAKPTATFYDLADGATAVATLSARAVIANHWYWLGLSYDGATKVLTLLLIEETGNAFSAVSAARASACRMDRCRILARTVNGFDGALGPVVFRNHEITTTDLAAIRDTRMAHCGASALSRSGASLGGSFSALTQVKFAMGLTKCGDPSTLDGAGPIAGLPTGQSPDNVVAAGNFHIYDAARDTGWYNVSQGAVSVSGTLTYKDASNWRADYWYLGTPQGAVVASPTRGNVSGRGPVFRALAVGRFQGITKKVGSRSNSRDQGTPSRVYSDGVRYREMYGGGLAAAAVLSKVAGLIQGRPSVSALSDFGIDLSAGTGRSKTSVQNSQNLSSFTRFGCGSANGTLGPGAYIRGDTTGGASPRYQTLTAAVTGSLYSMSSARTQRMLLLCYPGGPTVNYRRVSSNVSIVTSGTDRGGSGSVNCQTHDGNGSPTVVTYDSVAITAVTTGAGGVGGDRLVTAAGHTLSNGERVTIFGTGLSEIDGFTWVAGNVTAGTSFTLTGATGSGTSVTGTANPCKIVISGTGHNIVAGKAVFCASNATASRQCIAIAAASGSEGGGNTTITLENGFDVIGAAGLAMGGGPPAAAWNVRTGRVYFTPATVSYAGTETADTYQGMDVQKGSTIDIGDLFVYEEQWYVNTGGYAIGGDGWGGNGYTNQRTEGHSTYADPTTGLTHWQLYLQAIGADCFLFWPANNQGVADPPSLWATITTQYRAAMGPSAEVGWFIEWSRGATADPAESTGTTTPVSSGSSHAVDWFRYGSDNAATNNVYFLSTYDLGGTPWDQLISGRMRDASHNSILGYGDIGLQTLQLAGGSQAGGTGPGVVLSPTGGAGLIMLEEEELRKRRG